MRPTVAEFDFGWLINHVMMMSDAEIASELGLRHRNKSLLFTVWAPRLNGVKPPSPAPLKTQTGQVVCSASSFEQMKSCSPSPTSSRDPTPEVSPSSSPDSKPDASPPLSPPLPIPPPLVIPFGDTKKRYVDTKITFPIPPPLLIPVGDTKKRCVDTKITFCFKSTVKNKNDKIKKPRTLALNQDVGEDKPSQNIQHQQQKMIRPQMRGVDPEVSVSSARLSSVLSSEEPVEQQEKHEQWQKVTHTRRQGSCSGSGSVGRGRGRGIDTTKIKPLIPGLVGGASKPNPNKPHIPGLVGGATKTNPSKPLIPGLVGGASKPNPSKPLIPGLVGGVGKTNPNQPLIQGLVGDVSKANPSKPLIQGLVGGTSKSNPSKPLIPGLVGSATKTNPNKPLIPGLVGGVGKTNLNWIQPQPTARGRGRGRGHLGKNSQSQIQQASVGQNRQGLNSKAMVTEGLPTPSAEGSSGSAKQTGNVHGKPQQISVITANRTRKKKKNTSIAFDNGLKFRL